MHTRRTDDLRKRRISIPGTRYFLTCCMSRPMAGVALPSACRAIREAFDRLSSDENWCFHAATIMPDHIHVIFVLGGNLGFARLISKLKTLSICPTFQWQPNYFEHRLRPDELANTYARYIFLNPYRAGLLPRCSVWPHWIVGANGGNWDFMIHLEDGKFPPSEWLIEEEDIDPACVGKLSLSGMS
jgi:putative transposase